MIAYLFGWLFGAYYCTGIMGRMGFITLYGAEKFRAGHTIDPYWRGMQGAIIFAPGVWARKEPRTVSAWCMSCRDRHQEPKDANYGRGH